VRPRHVGKQGNRRLGQGWLRVSMWAAVVLVALLAAVLEFQTARLHHGVASMADRAAELQARYSAAQLVAESAGALVRTPGDARARDRLADAVASLEAMPGPIGAHDRVVEAGRSMLRAAAPDAGRSWDSARRSREVALSAVDRAAGAYQKLLADELAGTSERVAARSRSAGGLSLRLVGVVIAAAAIVLLGIVEPTLRRLRHQERRALRRQAEGELLSEVARRTTNGVILANRDRRVVWVNEGFTRLTGYELYEAIGRAPRELLLTEEGRRAVDAGIEREGFFRGEVRLRRKDGSLLWSNLEIQPRVSESGESLGFIAVNSDVTERKLAEAGLERALAELEGFFSSSLELLCIAEGDGRFVRVSRSWSELLGLPADELEGRSFFDFVHPEDMVATRAVLERADAGAMVRGFRNRYRAGDGSWRTLEWRSTQIGDRIYGAARDVTEQLELQRAISAEAERTQLALDGGELGLWDWSVDTGETVYDDRYAAMLGETAESLGGTVDAWSSRVHPDDVEGAMARVRACFERDAPFQDVRFRMRHRDGRWRWIRASGKVVSRDAQGRPLRMVGTHMDVTDQVLAQRALQQREALLANTERIAGVGGWELELEDSSLHWSDQVRIIHEVDADYQPTLESAIAFYEGPDKQVIARAVERAVEHREPFDVECRLRTARGRLRWVRSVGQPVVVNGRVDRLAGAFQDVTEARTQREALERANNALETAQAISRMGNWSLDLVTGRVQWSRQVFELFGLPATHGPPNYAGSLAEYVDQSAPTLAASVDRAIREGTPYSHVLRTRHGRGGVRHVLNEGRVREDGRGEVIGLYGTVRDVTAEVEREEQLRDARARAEDASRSKSEFLANMSHEIRTPMTAILGYADLLGEADLSDGVRADYLATIRRNGEHLLAIINDVLDLSKIEAGRMAIETMPVRVGEVAADVLGVLGPSATSRGLTLGGVVRGAAPASIETDPTRLRQILMNLVGNAIKFTERGSVELRIEADGHRLRFEVRDTGIGMTDQQLATLFDAFTQADASMTRRYGGTGLGLSISRRLASMLGGDITVSSVPGQGSTFTLGLPLRGAGEELLSQGPLSAPGGRAAARHATGQTQRALEGVRVLLVEDGPDNRRLITHLLRKAGAEVVTAANGRLGVASLTAGGDTVGPLADPPPVDLVVTDMQMPEMDGYEAIRLLREKGCVLPIVALTAHAMAGASEACFEAGCDAYATKPIAVEALLDACRSAMRGRGSALASGERRARE